MEDPNTVAFLKQLIGICFEDQNVPEPILEPFSALVAEHIITEHPEVVFQNDFAPIQRIVSQFSAPGRTGDGDQGIFMCHWMPLNTDEKKKHSELLRRARQEHDAR